MDAHLQELAASTARLRQIVEALPPERLEAPGYPSKWTIADVLSHIGSGAEIMRRRVEDAVAGTPTPDDAAPAVWDAWNAKSPEQQTKDALASDRALVDTFELLPEATWAALRFQLGPMDLDTAGFVAMRLNEHVLHSWDIQVAVDPSATLPPDATALVIDNLAMIAGFTARPAGDQRTIAVRTTGPERTFTIAVAGDGVTFTPGAAGADSRTPDLELPAEAFIRLVYGRLDPDHTPETEGAPSVLDQLRQVFPGL